MMTYKRSQKQQRNTKPSKSSLATKRYVKRIIDSNIEDKFYDTNVTPSIGTSGTAPYINRLTNIPQGTGSSNRVGDKIKLKSLSIRFSADASTTNNKIRYALIQWKGSSLTPPTLADVFHNTGSSLSPINQDNDGTAFRVLKHGLLPLNLQSASITKPKAGFMYIPAKKMLKNVSWSTAVEGNNHIYFCAYSDSTAIPHPTINYYARVLYEDA